MEQQIRRCLPLQLPHYCIWKRKNISTKCYQSHFWDTFSLLGLAKQFFFTIPPKIWLKFPILVLGFGWGIYYRSVPEEFIFFFMLNLAICLLFFKTAFNSRMIHRPQWLAVRAQLTRSPSLSDLCGSLAEREEYFLPNKIYCVGKHTQGLFCRQLEGLLLIVVEK